MKYSYSSIKKSFHNQEPWINVLFLKYITMPLVYFMVNFTKITPNIISILSITFGFFSAYSYYIGETIIGGLMYFVSYIFDATDGKVARITRTGKPYGAWMDICIDRINLVLISTAIAFNFYSYSGDVSIIFLNCFFLGFAFIGWESRYNIDIYKIKKNIEVRKETKNSSRYSKWCKSKGLINAPISLPEIFLFYLIFAPSLHVEIISLFIICACLILRILLQQKFWVGVINNK